ncbi:hypothetical protein FF38_08574 [Lucilia cuprina]|uniref:Uncharacterized protein n=1 Tax=Lucilia cuprina TaxID=7375 RepID=A0A0L0C273_LUCCU|nr:hypothetical protein FF38_08574 [Lucilia cuprina]
MCDLFGNTTSFVSSLLSFPPLTATAPSFTLWTLCTCVSQPTKQPVKQTFLFSSFIYNLHL